jgi:hypothetical protein
VGDDGNPSSAFPLSKCEGDCDVDSDCESGLKCFQRDGGDSTLIPGCDGTPGADRTDFCYDPANAPGSTPTDDDTFVSAPTTPAPVVAAAPTVVAATPTVAQPTFPTDTHPVAIQGTLDKVGGNQNPSNAFPLGLCEGDCDGDTDCEGGLVCHQRDGNETVPSCEGTGDSDMDYCIHAADETARPPVAGAFRLKHYWEQGYHWQEQNWEQEWCIQCDGNGCSEGDNLYISTCDDNSDWFQFKNLTNGVTQVKAATTNLCMEWVGSRDVELHTCDASNERQKVTAGEGSFYGGRFELDTYAQEGGCLSQDHHPKDGEQIYRFDCGYSRGSTTSYWIKY